MQSKAPIPTEDFNSRYTADLFFFRNVSPKLQEEEAQMAAEFLETKKEAMKVDQIKGASTLRQRLPTPLLDR
jgi:hypothetical protein